MVSRYKQNNLLRTLIILTSLFMLSQIIFSAINGYVGGLIDIARLAITTKLFFTRAVIPPILFFVFSQLLIYTIFIFGVWVVSISIAELFSIRGVYAYVLGLLLWLNNIAAILLLNMYYVPHSIFTSIVRDTLFAGTLTDPQIQYAAITTSSIALTALVLAIINMIFSAYGQQRQMRTSITLFLIAAIIFFAKGPAFFSPHQKHDASSAATPNIIVISFDALRPDHLSFFNKDRPITPNFDAFLNSAIVFPETYTPIARTSPSWASILTSQYPLHHHVRENNTYLNGLSFKDSLPNILKKSGYETIYATDDKLFNVIDQHFGFDRLIGPRGTVADYLLSNINDFPLSNLLIPTRLGKILFPYSYGNHAAARTYNPNNFLDSINLVLHRRSNKPVFLAVHFDLSGWPYYWFNDKSNYNAKNLSGYGRTILGDDQLLANFMTVLNQNHLLTHALVILLSDHGITIGNHGDRVVAETLFQGDKANMQVLRSRYNDAYQATLNREQLKQAGGNFNEQWDKNVISLLDKKNYGIDSSYGYGGDVLSLNQHHALFAIKAYGLDIGVPHQVQGRNTLLDMAPTILDLLKLPAIKASEGISLKPYLSNTKLTLSPYRPIYLESAFSPAEIEQQEILVSQVVAKNIAYFYINPKTGAVTLQPRLMKILTGRKQRAILEGDWLLAFYPDSERFRWVFEHTSANKKGQWMIENRIVPAYFVLVNLKTGEWTTEKNNPLMTHSPFTLLKSQLELFYGKEMNV